MNEQKQNLCIAIPDANYSHECCQQHVELISHTQHAHNTHPTHTHTHTMPYSAVQWMLLPLLLSLTAVIVSGGTNEAGLSFLKENASQPGVITLSSGLQYRSLHKGTGTTHPAVNSPCSCHYAGTLIDGSTFDSSYDRGSPSTFAPNQVIKGVSCRIYF
jgi:hypothetical protein